LSHSLDTYVISFWIWFGPWWVSHRTDTSTCSVHREYQSWRTPGCNL